MYMALGVAARGSVSAAVGDVLIRLSEAGETGKVGCRLGRLARYGAPRAIASEAKQPFVWSHSTGGRRRCTLWR